MACGARATICAERLKKRIRGVDATERVVRGDRAAWILELMEVRRRSGDCQTAHYNERENGSFPYHFFSPPKRFTSDWNVLERTTTCSNGTNVRLGWPMTEGKKTNKVSLNSSTQSLNSRAWVFSRGPP